MTNETEVDPAKLPDPDDIAAVLGPGVVPSATANTTLAAQAQWLHALKIARDAAKESYQKAEAEYAEQEGILFDMLENAGLESIRVPGVGLFSMNDLAWPQVVDAAKAVEWAENEHPDWVTLNHQRLQTPIREALRGEGEITPEQFAEHGIGYTTSRKIRFTAAKG